MPKQKVEFEIDVPDGWELRSLNNFLIVRKVFTLPDWIPSGWWVAKDRDGQIYCYELEPSVDRNQSKWVAGGRYALLTALFDGLEIDLPNVPWHEAKWQQVEKTEVKDY